MNIQELSELLGQELKLRFPDVNGKWFGSFSNGEVKEGGLLLGVCGRADTPGEAIDDYVRRIAGKKMVFDAGSDTRTEFNIPKDLAPLEVRSG